MNSELKQLAESGEYNKRTLAARLGLSYPTLQKQLKEQDIKIVSVPRPKRLQQLHGILTIDVLRQMFVVDLVGIEFIARKFEVSESIPTSLINQFGLKKEKNLRINQLHVDIQNLYAQGLKYSEISIQLDISIQRISDAMKNCKQIIRKPNSYPRKFHRQSKIELSIANWLTTEEMSFTSCDRKTLDGLEIDILLPEHNIGIEINGMIYHSEQYGKARDYHQQKVLKARKAGIQLLMFYEDQLHTKLDIVKSMIMSKAGKIATTIYARKTTIQEIEPKTKSSFLNANHIQGNDKAEVAFGLFYETELVAVMSFARDIYNNKYDAILNRYCSRNNVTVVGGFSKLLAHFIKIYNPSTIVSYSDNDWTSGNVYTKNKFELVTTNQPTYFYYDPNKNKRYHRSAFKRSDIIRKFKLSSEEQLLTETQMINLPQVKLFRIWTSGTSTWLYTC